MKKYRTEQIRNVVLLGGSSSGKTTLVEAADFASGKRNKLGSIAEGNTVSDYDKEEIARGFSIHMSVVPVEWKKCKINLLDTPGAPDFSGERQQGLSAADAAVIVVNGRKKVDEGVYYAWKLCDQYQLPRIVFVTGMDDDDASYKQAVLDLKERYGSVIAPFSMPIRQNQRLMGYADVTTMTARRYNGVGKYEDMELPDYCKDNLLQYKQVLDEAIASSDESKMDKYFDGEPFTQEEVEEGLRMNCLDGSIAPVIMGSGLHVYGIDILLDAIVKYLPGPVAEKQCVNTVTNEMETCSYQESQPMAAQVFKTLSDPYIGRYSFVKVYDGVLKADSSVYNPTNDTQQRIGRLYDIHGAEFIPTDYIVAGDIGAIPKLSDVMTSDTITVKEHPMKFPSIEFEQPYTVKQYQTMDKKNEDKVLASLLKLLDEDRTIQIKNDRENGQQLLLGIGEQQLEILKDRLLHQYKIQIQLLPPRIAYRETICKNVDARGRFKKQTGGHGQFGDVYMTFGPSGNREEQYTFEQQVVGGAVPKNYIPAVQKGIEESVKAGPYAGYPVVGLKAILTDGSYHPVDSSENAFRMAAVLAFKEAYKNAEPILLEPVASVKIHAASIRTGDIVSDLKTRRARVMGMTPVDQYYTDIDADIPMAELDGYLTRLRSICGGYVTMTYEFARYAQAPESVAKSEVEQFTKAALRS